MVKRYTKGKEVNTMKVDVRWFKQTVSKDEDGDDVWDNEALLFNRNLLKEDVVGLKVINENDDFTPTADEVKLVKRVVPNMVSVGTVERYEGGAKNLFFRIQIGGAANGVVRVRP